MSLAALGAASTSGTGKSSYADYTATISRYKHMTVWSRAIKSVSSSSSLRRPPGRCHHHHHHHHHHHRRRRRRRRRHRHRHRHYHHHHHHPPHHQLHHHHHHRRRRRRRRRHRHRHRHYRHHRHHPRHHHCHHHRHHHCHHCWFYYSAFYLTLSKASLNLYKVYLYICIYYPPLYTCMHKRIIIVIIVGLIFRLLLTDICISILEFRYIVHVQYDLLLYT